MMTYDKQVNQLVTLTYETRDIGYGVEAETVEGHFTGEVDTWGKHTFVPAHTPGVKLYLFDDEIIEVMGSVR